MGNCLGREEGTEIRRDNVAHGVVAATGKNQPLQPTPPVWQSEVPITKGQLLSKRDEFWDTAPMFDGRKEIWDALKAAAYALESNDAKLAQAVVHGANISLPTGSLSECYDELGNRYQLPVYVLSAPTNLIELVDEEGVDALCDDEVVGGEDVSLKLRLSSGKDVKIVVRTTETIARAKQKLACAELEGALELSQQRWFFGGRVLGDKLRIEDARIPKGYVVQVVLPLASITTKEPPSVAEMPEPGGALIVAPPADGSVLSDSYPSADDRSPTPDRQGVANQPSADGRAPSEGGSMAPAQPMVAASYPTPVSS